jgi:hypothetical protein
MDINLCYSLADYCQKKSLLEAFLIIDQKGGGVIGWPGKLCTETGTGSYSGLEWQSVEFTVFLNTFIFLVSASTIFRGYIYEQSACTLWIRSNYSCFSLIIAS